MELQYLGESSFLTTNNKYVCYGILSANTGYSFLIKDDINKFRIWDSQEFQVVQLSYPFNKWSFYQNNLTKTSYSDWSDDYIIENFLFFGDNYFVNNPKDLLAVYTWENNQIYIEK